jgi:hypothetical protein
MTNSSKTVSTHRGKCRQCGKWPVVNQKGTLNRHDGGLEHNDLPDEFGRCEGSYTTPVGIKEIQRGLNKNVPVS